MTTPEMLSEIDDLFKDKLFQKRRNYAFAWFLCGLMNLFVDQMPWDFCANSETDFHFYVSEDF